MCKGDGGCLRPPFMKKAARRNKRKVSDMKAKASVCITGYISFTHRKKNTTGGKALVSLAGAFSLALLFSACLEPMNPLNVSSDTGKLTITVFPTVMEYPRNSPFDVAGIEVKWIFNGFAREVTADVTYSWNGSPLKPGDTSLSAEIGWQDIAVNYSGEGLNLSTTFRIDVKSDADLDGIFVTKLPALTEYPHNHPFDTAGIEVKLYKDGHSDDITDKVTYSWNSSPLKPGDTSISAEYGPKDITVSYSGGGLKFDTVFRVNVMSDLLPDGLVVTKPPATLEYPRNSPFDPAGIGVTLFEGGFAKNVTESVTYSWNGNGLLPGNTSITAQYGVKEVTVSYGGHDTFFRIEVLSDANLDGIFVTVPPALTEYRRNQPFDPAGIKVMLFTGGGSREVTGETTYGWNGAELKPGDTSATAGFGQQEIKVIHGGSGFEASFGISVLSDIIGDGLVVTGLPNLRYPRNSPFDTAGIEVMLFESGFAKNVTPDVTYGWNGAELKPGDTTVTATFGAKEIKVTYSNGGSGFDTVFGIEVLTDEKLEGIFVTVPPALTKYARNQSFDPDGIKVMFFDGGGATDVTGNVKYFWNDGTKDVDLEQDKTSVTAAFGAKTIKVTYSSGGADFETVFSIEVLSDDVREGLVVTRLPDNTTYERNQTFDPDGIEVTLFRNGGATVVTKNVTYGWDGGTLADVTREFGSKKITVSHNARSVFDTAAFWIEVSPVDGKDPDRLEITRQPLLTEYPVNQPFDPDGIKVMLVGDGWERDVTGDDVNLSYSLNGNQLSPGESVGTAGRKTIGVNYNFGGNSFQADFPIEVFTNHFIVTNGGEWTDALDTINTQTGDPYFFITVKGDFQIPSTSSASIPLRNDGILVTLRTLKGEDAVLRLGSPGSALYIKGAQTFIIDSEGLTLEGIAGNDKSLILVDGSSARLELKNGAVTGNTSSGDGGGVSVTGSGSRFIMSGGEISGNTAWNGGGVLVNGGSFDMTGGSVRGNTATASTANMGGGGVFLTANSTFTMSGRSSVSGNYAKQKGGGIFAQGFSTVTMLDESSVTGNEAAGTGGGGIYVGNYVTSPGTLNMKGGIISGNSCTYGAGVYSWSGGGLVQMENGVIYGNDAPAYLANKGGTGAALRLYTGGLGYRGTFTRDSAGNEVFTSTAKFNDAEDNTIKVKNGELVPYP